MPQIRYKLERCVGTSWGRKVVAKQYSKMCSCYTQEQLKANLDYFFKKGYIFHSDFELIGPHKDKLRYFNVITCKPTNLFIIEDIPNTTELAQKVESLKEDQAPTENKITRVEVIGETGREYVNWHNNNKVDLSLQDEGRTLKIFISKR